MIALGVALVVLGAVMIGAPRSFWRIADSWRTDGGQPSLLYVVSTRVGGAIMVLVGLATGGVGLLG